MLTASCRCGAVHIEAPKPDEITECSCSICRRYAARWAYYRRNEVRMTPGEEALERYAPADRLDFLRCRSCGCIVMWVPKRPEGEDYRMGVNLRLLDEPGDIRGVTIRRLDGKTWTATTDRTLDEPEW